MKIQVKLTDEEIKKCELIANGWDTTTGKYQIKWQQDNKKVNEDTLNGVKSEYIVAKILGFEYDGDIGKPGGYDVGGKYEVRTTTYRNGNLILHPNDKKADYILVTGEGKDFEVIGWIYSEDGKKQEYWRTNIRYPCFFVPQNKLNDIQLLINKENADL